MRWELNDLVRRLGNREVPVDLHAIDVVSPETSGSRLGKDARRMLDAIEALLTTSAKPSTWCGSTE